MASSASINSPARPHTLLIFIILRHGDIRVLPSNAEGDSESTIVIAPDDFVVQDIVCHALNETFLSSAVK